MNANPPTSADRPTLDRRQQLYTDLGRRLLPLVLLLLFALSLIYNSFNPALDKKIAFALSGPIPEKLREIVALVRYYGLPGIFIALFIFGLTSPTGKGWLAYAERACGWLFIRLADAISLLGEVLYFRRTPSILIFLVCIALTAPSLMLAYHRHETNRQLEILQDALTDSMITLVDNPVLHYRIRPYFDAVMAAETALRTADPNALKRMASEHDPAVCLYSALEQISRSDAHSWPRISQELADLDETIPVEFRDTCRPLTVYRASLGDSRRHYVHALASLTLAIAKINQQRGLEGTNLRETAKAAALFSRARQLYDDAQTPVREAIARASDNGVANYFSSCFSQWPSLGCEKKQAFAPDIIPCTNEEDCFHRSADYYTRLEEAPEPAVVASRRENNTIDLKMRALIKFSTPNELPPYVLASLSVDSGQPASPLTWLDVSIATLEKRVGAVEVAPELYVTLSQLSAVELRYVRQAPPHKRTADTQLLARKSVEFLELAQKLLAVDSSYFTTDIKKRGWCGLFEELEVASPVNDELRKRLLVLIGSLPIEEAENWLLDSCRKCKASG